MGGLDFAEEGRQGDAWDSSPIWTTGCAGAVYGRFSRDVVDI